MKLKDYPLLTDENNDVAVVQFLRTRGFDVTACRSALDAAGLLEGSAEVPTSLTAEAKLACSAASVQPLWQRIAEADQRISQTLMVGDKVPRPIYPCTQGARIDRISLHFVIPRGLTAAPRGTRIANGRESSWRSKN